MKDVTFVMMTCGEKTESQCLSAISSFRNQIEFFEVRNVFPQIKALNQMIAGVQTEFFVALDSDMVLDYDAWPRLVNAMNRHRHNENWHSILFPLWDTLTERKILALKFMRSSIMKANPFVESATPDVEHYQRLTGLGYVCIDDYLKQKPIGKHIISGKKFCYNKYRDVYQTYRAHNFEWDSGVFMGGTNLRERAKNHFDYFFYKYLLTGKLDYVHCIAGMMDGILSPIENKSKTLETQPYKIWYRSAIQEFMKWYTEPMMNTGYLI